MGACAVGQEAHAAEEVAVRHAGRGDDHLTRGELLAQGIDRRRAGAPPTIATWEALDRALAFWADRVCSRLEARVRG